MLTTLSAREEKIMTNLEYQSFQHQFHCSSSCDECYSAPFDVLPIAGGQAWTVYINGTEFRAARAWLTSFRAAAAARTFP
jgi:hypothetical protein